MTHHSDSVDDVHVIGVDLGGTKLRAGLADDRGEILAETTVPTARGGGGVVEQIVDLVAALSTTAGVPARSVRATGVGGAGVPSSDEDGFTHAPNLFLSGGEGFGPALAGALGHRVAIENDVNVAALGELHHGVGRHHRNFVCISVGTGVGMGIVADGQLFRGAHGAAGEIGYLPFGADPFDTSNHRRGALEEVLAGDRLAHRFTAATGRQATAELVFEAAGSGDPAARDSIAVEAKALARAIAAVHSVLDTEVVVLTGGIGGRAELLAQTNAWLAELGLRHLPVIHSSLGADAPLVGAVHLALDNVELKGEVKADG